MKLLNSFCNRLACALALAVMMYASGAQAEVVVVVSAQSTVTRLTATQVKDIFLGKTGVFPNGNKAVPIDQIEDNPPREDFYLKVANKSPAQLSAYWAQVIFTGNGFPPESLSDDKAVKRAVANNSNAIGYIDRGAVDSSVRIILVP
jgi:ABC-type phosphate transport system substrate-binding protein